MIMKNKHQKCHFWFLGSVNTVINWILFENSGEDLFLCLNTVIKWILFENSGEDLFLCDIIILTTDIPSSSYFLF